MNDDMISRQAAIDVIEAGRLTKLIDAEIAVNGLKALPSAQPEIAENLYLCKCLITDQDGLQHEVIHTGDIRRVTGWEI